MPTESRDTKIYCPRRSHKEKELLRLIGTLKAVVLTGDPKCKDIVLVSLYDAKPVYLLSNACEKIQWTKKEQKLWNNEKGKKVDAPFYRLKLIDEYNMGMGNVDQADQLRLHYRVHYCLRNQKWWFAIFFGALNYHSQIVMFYIECSLNFTINHHHTSITGQGSCLLGMRLS